MLVLICNYQFTGDSATTVQIKTASRLGLLPPYLFAELDRLKKEVAAKGVDVISLGIGDPDLPTPAHIISSIKRASDEPRTIAIPITKACSNTARPPRHGTSAALALSSIRLPKYAR